MLNNIVALLGNGSGGGGGSYESIATVTASGGETSFTFSSVPSTYKHLQIRGFAMRNSFSSIDIALQFNSDTGSNYAYHNLYGDGSSVSAAGITSYTGIKAGIGGGSTVASTFGGVIVDIHDYASTSKNKTTRSFSGIDKNGSGSVWLNSGLWMNTAAISTIKVYFFGDAVASGTTFALYGIKG